MSDILVTSYTDPDLDGFAGSIGYAELLQKQDKTAIAGFFGQFNTESRFLVERFNFPYPPLLKNTSQFSSIVLVDASELNHLEGVLKPEAVIEIIDHRAINDADKFPNATVQIELVGAACTLVAERFMKSDHRPSVMSAILLGGGIVSNTLNFRSKTTTARDHEAFRWLSRVTPFPPELVHDMFASKSNLAGENLFKHIDDDFAWFTMARQKVGIGQLEIIGVQQLVAERITELVKTLHTLRAIYGLDKVFLSLIDLEKGTVSLVTDEEETKWLLENTLGVTFRNMLAVRDSLIMRKEIVPLLKRELEGQKS